MVMDIPNQEQLVEILSADGAPPFITLDIGGSEDINGDGFVRVSLDTDGNLVTEDA